jgi:phage tail sheath protein FI
MAVTSYKHGVTWRDIPTSIVAPIVADSGIPVAVGAAPVFQASSPAPANSPRVYLSYDEAVLEMGYSDDFKTYPLCEVMYTYFALFNTGPIVLINVLDQDDVKFKGTGATAVAHNFTNGILPYLSESLKVPSLVVHSVAPAATLVAGTDYTGDWQVDPSDGEQKYTLLAIPGGKITMTGTFAVTVTYDEVDATKVDKSDIIGGIDVDTGFTTGLEAIEDVFPKLGIVPGILLAPQYTIDPEVAAVISAKAADINGCFKCITLCDIDSTSTGVIKAIDVFNWKNTNNFTDPRQGVCWPRVGLVERDIWLSTELGARIELTDNDNNNVPVETPSNKLLKMNQTLVGDYGNGQEVVFSKLYGDMLNGQGVLTAINWIGGWKAWGSNMACYPANSDPKDRWMPERRMTDWVGNTLVLTMFQKVDKPTNRRLIDQIVDSVNIWLNSLVSAGNALGARVEFRHDENADTDLINGHLLFHVYEFFPLPAEWIEFILELDISYLSVLFSDQSGSLAA